MSNPSNYSVYQPHEPLIQTRLQSLPQHYNLNPPIQEQQIKDLVQHLKLNEKIKMIDQRKDQYKRSTNNCHKKYITILKNHFFLKLSQQIKDQIQRKYKVERNSRVYFFILLSYMKWMLSIEDIKQVYTIFCDNLDQKISSYKKQIGLTRNTNFINFRYAQIKEMQYALFSVRDYFRGLNESAIRNLYQKDKRQIVKKNQYLKSLQIIELLEKQLTRAYDQIDIKTKLRDLDIQSVREMRPIKSFSILVKSKKQNHEYTTNTKIKNKYDQDEEDQDDSEYIEDQQNQAYSKKKITHQNQYIQQKSSSVKSQVKREDPVIIESDFQIQKIMPLLQLETSYPPVNFGEWHLFLMQKHIEIDLRMKTEANIISLIQSYKIHSILQKFKNIS